MKRKILALCLAVSLAAGIMLTPGSAAFTDIDDQNVAIAAAVLNSMGIVEGITETEFSPNGSLTRAQFCALSVRAMGLADKTALHANKALFTDVKPGVWYTEYVNTAWTEGIVNGYGNGTFGPNDAITYGQVATLLLRMLGYSDDEIGRRWPEDYVNYANNLGINDGVNASANDKITRGQAALLLYNAIKTEVNGTTIEYFYTTANVASTQTAIVLDVDASSGGSSGQLQACVIGATGATIEYFSQRNAVSETLEGYVGVLLLNNAGRVIGFVPSADKYADVRVSSASASTITAANGETHRVSSGASVIYNGSIYNYSVSGYLQVDAQSGKNVRLYYDEDDAIRYIYIASGSSSGSATALAQVDGSVSTLARELGASGSYTITKNSSAATAEDIARYDVAYYDSATKTLRVSDYRIGGAIEGAFPNIAAAETITVSGCTLEVLESAWDTLGDFYIGDRVTLLLTDDCKVAAAYRSSAMPADMIGVLAKDGRSITLSDSSLVITADTIDANVKLYGGLVSVSATGNGRLACRELVKISAKVDISEGAVGEYSLAPSCAIYEWAGSGYVYSLSGAPGQKSADFEEISWTRTLTASEVSYYHLNSAGQIDVLLLNDVTGNSYVYGRFVFYEGFEGINLGNMTMPSYNDAIGIENSLDPTGSVKYLYNSANPGYGGVALAAYNEMYAKATPISLSSAKVSGSEFYLDDDDWYVTMSGREVKVSSGVQVYITGNKTWTSAENGISYALSSGLELTAYYNKTLDTGAQVRILVVG